MLAQSYLGNHVIINNGIKEISGKVDAVEKLEDGSIRLEVGGESYDPKDVSRVQLASNTGE
jgi:hypothetical protein